MLRYSIGSLAAIIKSIVYGSATGLFSLLQSARATMVLPSIGTIFTGAAATGVRVVVATDDKPGTPTSGLLRNAAESVTHDNNPDDDDGREHPPPYRPTVPEEHPLTPQAILAIVKSWDVGTYNPPGTNYTSWLGKVHSSCQQYGIPACQRALCAMHHMRADCKEAAHAAECYDMTWDEFATWLDRYNRKLHTLMLIGALR